MDNNTAKEIITEYIFADYNMNVLNRYLNANDQDQLHREAPVSYTHLTLPTKLEV